MKNLPSVKVGPGVVEATQPLQICPNGQTECSESETCCLFGSGTYGCCQYASASCCADQQHCCPSGTSCNLDTGSCDVNFAAAAFRSLLMKKIDPSTVSKKTFVKLVNSPQNVMCPDGKSECASGSTCCLTTDGVYGCCPRSNAVCCSDEKHCCPAGYTCETAAGTCTKGVSVISFLEKLPAITSPQNVKCPDGKSECASGSTCCLTTDGVYGCCPRSNAVCCSDEKHCCPAGYTCETAAGTCTKGDTVISFLEKLPALTSPNIICPDKVHSCASDASCCQLESGKYGCCPVPNANCCSDDEHCCPSGYSCNTADGTCSKGDAVIPIFKKQPAQDRTFPYSPLVKEVQRDLDGDKSQVVVCPDGQSTCATGETCCTDEAGGYGCCPHTDAMCCSDHKNCCPSGYTCDLTKEMCLGIGSEVILPVSKKRPAKPVSNGKDSVDAVSIASPQRYFPCPGQTVLFCLVGQTCCRNETGQWACCPYVNAVCCNDNKTCCEYGNTCVNGRCHTKQGLDVPASKHRSAVTINEMDQALIKPASIKPAYVSETPNSVCPDGKRECDSNSTCCLTTDGVYGCCPVPNAVCCSDKKHCCPFDYACDTTTGKCTDGVSVISFLEKLPAITSPQNVKCPDGKSECASGSTCCLTTDGVYGCCPRSNAVCCSDEKHCCPAGYTCETAAGTCTKGVSVISFLEKLPAITSPQNVKCPDGKSECASGSTCCLTTDGVYGCCPRSNAVCCSDEKHCCPAGYTCETAAGTCTKGVSVISFLEKLPAITSPQNVKCPDGKSECASGSTCCLTTDGVYGCCPRSNAVCCSDEKHCCPAGYTCETAAGTCTKGDSVISFLEKLPAISSPNIICPDKIHSCASDASCCQLKSGKYGCCPVPNANCCSDDEHCCPSGYSCNTADGTCSKGDAITPIFKKQPAKLNIVRPRVVICLDGKSVCPDGYTCCADGTGGFGCCHYVDAVCCVDHKSCCPSGYTCDLTAGMCVGASEMVLPLFEKLPAKQLSSYVSKPQNVKCPDGKSECASGSTCCLTTDGVYGCCPRSNAVCCSDEKHCCPSGYTCETAAGTCTKGVSVISFLEKLPAITSPQFINCPDKSVCPDKDTCCEIATGQYGCCPQDNGVCCTDGEHCCPAGYTCDLAQKTCTKGKVGDQTMMKKIGTMSEVKNVICPNESSECPDSSSCCPKNGSFACCPTPNAVCCSDGEHCCPKGYVCNLVKKSCDDVSTGVEAVLPFLYNQDAVSIPWYPRQAQHDQP